MAKNKTIFLCSNCGFEVNKWRGQCPDCSEWNTFAEEVGVDNIEALKLEKVVSADVLTMDLKHVPRISTKVAEFDRVLGGGFLPGQVVLLTGDPGIGKSTLLLQVFAKLSNQGVGSSYISSEESLEQIAYRAKRIVKKKGSKKLQVVTGFEINSLLAEVDIQKTKVVIIDSIQTVYDQEARGLPGGVAQVKAVSSKIVNFAKTKNVAVIIVGHINKEGSIAGPKLLEHLVDAVFHLEGDEKRGFRILRSSKNRFGSVNEVGLFQMSGKGMQEVVDASSFFHHSKEKQKVGICKTAVVEGNRVLIYEVQALVTNSYYSMPKRVSEGISRSRLEIMAAIINKYTKYNLGTKDLFLNVSGGFNIKDSSIDLAIVISLVSSLLNKSIATNIVAVGEVSLSGDIGSVVKIDLINKEINRFGYKNILGIDKGLRNIRDICKVF